MRCDGCNYLKSLDVRLSPQAVICEFRLFAGDSEIVKESSISFWDGLIVSAAVFARCKVIFTEDLNSGEVIAGVKVENPL